MGGFGGTVLTSPEGQIWTGRNSGTSLGLYSVAHGNNTFVAVGQIILSSPDGITWTVRDSGAGFSYETVAYLNGGFMTVGAGGALRVSPDGTNWSARASGTAAALYGIAYGNGMYVVTGAGGTIRTSPDGINWTARGSGTAQDINGVTYGNGQFVAQGNSGVVLTSVNGIDWMLRSSGTGQGLATSGYGLGCFVIVGLGGVILSSPDGASWTIHNSGTAALLIGVAGGPDGFVVVGDSGTILQSGAYDPHPRITVQPQDQTVTAGASASFTVLASGNPPLTFQWYYSESQALPDATNSSLVINGAQEVHAGAYHVIVSNASGTATSRVARLDILTAPRIVATATNLMTNTVSSTFSIGASIIGSPPPFFWIWKSNSTVVRSNISYASNDFVSFLTPSTIPASAVRYRLEVTNLHGTQLVLYSNIVFYTNYIVADWDADGLPDTYEAAYGGGALNPLGDADGDGMRNLDEYLAGTNPTNAASYLKVEASISAGGVLVSFGAEANRTYTLQRRGRVDSAPWESMTHFVSTPGARNESVLDPTGETNKFYRIVTPAQP